MFWCFSQTCGLVLIDILCYYRNMATIPEDAAPLDSDDLKEIPETLRKIQNIMDKLKNGEFEPPEPVESSYKQTDVPIRRFTKWIYLRRHLPLPRLPRMYDGFSARLHYNNKTSIQ